MKMIKTIHNLEQIAHAIQNPEMGWNMNLYIRNICDNFISKFNFISQHYKRTARFVLSHKSNVYAGMSKRIFQMYTFSQCICFFFVRDFNNISSTKTAALPYLIICRWCNSRFDNEFKCETQTQINCIKNIKMEFITCQYLFIWVNIFSK